MHSIAEIRARTEKVFKALQPYWKEGKKKDLEFRLLTNKLDRLHKDFKNIGKDYLWEIQTAKGIIYLVGVNKTDAVEIVMDRFGLEVESIKSLPTSKIVVLSKENDP